MMLSRKQVVHKQNGRPETGVIEAIAEGRHGDVFSVLGPHVLSGTGADAILCIRAFLPGAEGVEVLAADGAPLGQLEQLDSRGFFSGAIAGLGADTGYRLRVSWPGGEEIRDDPYRFPTTLGALDLHLLAEGRHLRLYEVLGAHTLTVDGVEGVAFAVWAPNARRASVVGSFNHWDGRVHVMRFHPGAGIWEMFIPGVVPGAIYKYEIMGPDGSIGPLKADPVGFAAEHPPATASVVVADTSFAWSDDEWMERRAKAIALDAPVSIYECHLGSWARDEAGNRLSWDRLAETLIPYAVEMGFSHLELLPISEFPFNGSWGYQPVGLFAPTSRFGSPADFARFVNRAHEAGIGIILDWVPGHFPTDPHGLARFDGTALYEHADPRQGFQQDWNTLVYNYGRREVANFLIANALYWLDRYHVDGLRVDAVASMLYLDYSRKPGEWVPNAFGGNENLEAVAFLRTLNETAYQRHPGIVMIAEESTSWPKVSRPVYDGGLGFGYKWNLGWMNDTLAYMREDPLFRSHHQDRLTFGLLYQWNENFILPLSHDEVVHGKGSLLGKMPGDQWQKFANLRAYFGFMWSHPGKKLIFMGDEFAQGREWNHDTSLDWHLLDQPEHRGIRQLVRDLNRAYRETPALHQGDCDPAGFEWVDCSDREHSVIAYLRRATDGSAPCLAVCNFTPVVRHEYRIGVPVSGRWREIINTDATDYGGSGVGNLGAVEAEAVPWHGQPYSVSATLPPLATLILQPG